MKKMFFVCAVLIISSPALVNNSYAQTAHTLIEIKPPVNEISSKALRNFTNKFKQASGETWFATDDGGFVVKFKQHSVETRADYDKNGNWLYTIRTYDENEMSAELRHLIKSSYYDYSILLVQEIEMPFDNFTYIVHLEGKTKLINLRINNGDMEEWQKFDKSK
jgi:hypothetical protein